MDKSGFVKYLEEAIGKENARIAFSAFGQAPSVSIRRNPEKGPGSPLPSGQPVPWNPLGTILENRPNFTLDPIFHAGGYYVQDSSSMFVGHIFRDILDDFRDKLPERPLRVLDLCAAPGGKTTDLAASMRMALGDNFILVSNEVMKQRSGILADNVAIWGDPNLMVTSADPSCFPRLGRYFDIVAADVPCSGEGMFRKDEEALAQWSEDNVALCQSRQRRIIADMWDSLAEGGILIYSTCTFNRLENDLNIKWICDNLGAEPYFAGNRASGDFPGVLKTQYGYLLVPGLVKGEGQYCSAVIKTSGRSSETGRRPSRKSACNTTAERQLRSMLPEGLFRIPARLYAHNGYIDAVPQQAADEFETVSALIKPIGGGCRIGMPKGKDFIPSADLALSLMLAPGIYPEYEADLQTALRFLHRDSVSASGPKGFICMKYDGLRLGFVKNIGNRCNNLHPASRRIRMDIL